MSRNDACERRGYIDGLRAAALIVGHSSPEDEPVTVLGRITDAIDSEQHRPDDAQRWHEIATEGLPPEGVKVLVWIPNRESSEDSIHFGAINLRDGRLVWCDTDYDAYRFDPEDEPTDWHPLPSPPVVMVDGQQIVRATERAAALLAHIEPPNKEPSR